MTSLQIRLLAAFGADPTGGNIGGVVFEDVELTKSQRQQIASDLAVSTTAFIREYDNSSFDVKFHSSRSEMDMCGHATVAAFAGLKIDGRIEAGSFSQRTASGELQVEVTDDNQIFMLQPQPKFWDLDLEKPQVAALLNLPEKSLVQIASAGTALRHLFVELESIAALTEIIPDDQGLRRFCVDNRIDTIGVWFPDAFKSGEARYRLRDLCHGVGDPEEAASGTTNGALASYLWHSGRARADETGRLLAVARQGYEMGRPSVVETQLRISENGIDAVRVGGSASLRLQGSYFLDRS